MDLQKIRHPEHNPALRSLLTDNGLTLPEDTDDNLGLYEGAELVGCGFLKGNMIQGLAIHKNLQGEGFSATLVSGLIKLAAEHGIRYIRVITKPAMVRLLAGLGLRVVAEAPPYAAFLEFGGPDPGLEQLRRLRDLHGASCAAEGSCACIVMNCNPFTKGHRMLIERAAAENPWVWVLAVEEDRSEFPFRDRIALMREGAEDLRNVRVIPGGEYVISSFTFPAYFTRDAERARAQGALDAALFTQVIAPILRVIRRYVGSEPLSAVTAEYNRALWERLPPCGIEVIEVPRFEVPEGLISASTVREGIRRGDWDLVRAMVPDCTWRYLRTRSVMQ
jgi:[citrate (pro-3S)-lyase] ligase